MASIVAALLFALVVVVVGGMLTIQIARVILAAHQAYQDRKENRTSTKQTSKTSPNWSPEQLPEQQFHVHEVASKAIYQNLPYPATRAWNSEGHTQEDNDEAEVEAVLDFFDAAHHQNPDLFDEGGFQGNHEDYILVGSDLPHSRESPDVERNTTSKQHNPRTDIDSRISEIEMNSADLLSITIEVNPDLPQTIDKLQSLAGAIKYNTTLQTFTLIFEPETTPGFNAYFPAEAALTTAFQFNTSITALSLVGSDVPPEWRMYCCRNSALAKTSPRPTLPPAIGPDEIIDLTSAPWASPADSSAIQRQEEYLGHGAMGTVYKITVHGEEVAAKGLFTLLNPTIYGLDRDPEHCRAAVEECWREMNALRRLGNHENVISFRGVLYETINDMAVPVWILMDLADITLHERIRQGESNFLLDMLGIARGLEHIHNQGMMHRDLKPKNVLVRGETIKIGDLGNAKVFYSRTITFTDARHTAIGTPAYLAPEASNDRGEYDDSRDVYAVGVIAMEIILKEDPQGDHGNRMPQLSKAMRAQPRFAWLIQRCTARIPEQRPNCTGLRMALETIV